MSSKLNATIAFVAIALSACASQRTGKTPADEPAAATPSPTQSTAAAAPATKTAVSPYGPTRTVKSRDGRSDGEIIGTPAAGSKFAKLQIGMLMDEVTGMIGAPDNIARHETGKRWIPFYFGNDVQRFQVLYKGEGCLTFTAGNQFGGGGNELIRITATQRQDCIR